MEREVSDKFIIFSYLRYFNMDWVDDATTELEELEPIWRERAMEVLGEDSEKQRS